jgi:cytochrome d ubiquinol oxidase subunit I
MGTYGEVIGLPFSLEGIAFFIEAIFLVPFTIAALVTPVQIGVGDWAAHFVAEYQPVKLAAMEGVFETERGVPLHIGGLAVDGQMRYALEIPRGLSLPAHFDPDSEISGLNEVPPADRPPVNVVHWAFQIMVGCGFALLALSAWLGLAWRCHKRLPHTPWFLGACADRSPGARRDRLQGRLTEGE